MTTLLYFYSLCSITGKEIHPFGQLPKVILSTTGGVEGGYKQRAMRLRQAFLGEIFLPRSPNMCLLFLCFGAARILHSSQRVSCFACYTVLPYIRWVHMKLEFITRPPMRHVPVLLFKRPLTPSFTHRTNGPSATAENLSVFADYLRFLLVPSQASAV